MKSSTLNNSIVKIICNKLSVIYWTLHSMHWKLRLRSKLCVLIFILMINWVKSLVSCNQNQITLRSVRVSLLISKLDIRTYYTLWWIWFVSWSEAQLRHQCYTQHRPLIQTQAQDQELVPAPPVSFIGYTFSCWITNGLLPDLLFAKDCMSRAIKQ